MVTTSRPPSPKGSWTPRSSSSTSPHGDDIPRKGGPGVTTSDLLVINKTDLAPYVGSDLGRMAHDAAQQRGELPVAFTSLTSGEGVGPVADWVRGQLASWTA